MLSTIGASEKQSWTNSFRLIDRFTTVVIRVALCSACIICCIQTVDERISRLEQSNLSLRAELERQQYQTCILRDRVEEVACAGKQDSEYRKMCAMTQPI
jgi:uncharacterized membrane protein